VVHRLVTLALSVCVVLCVVSARMDRLFAQGEAKKEAQAPKTEPPKTDSPKTEPPKTDAAKTEPGKGDASKTDATKSAEAGKTEPAKPVEPPLPPIPPEVQVKIDAARRAVAEAIVAAQDAGLVETSIDPPPILDILINGRATDARALKATKKPYAVSPEVFAAWFTGYGKTDGINYVDDVRIINPSAGLKQWYDQRARMLQQLIDEIRKAKGQPAAPKAETKPAEAKKPAAGEPAKTETPKKK
jgi:hypothetical protein